MAKKENKGGVLTNEEIEKDLRVKGTADEGGHYSGSQDTGDKIIRQRGTDVQKQDGAAEKATDKDNQ